MHFIAVFFGIIATVTSLIGLLPQIYKSMKTRSTDDVSMLMLVNYAVCSVAWIVYGLSTASLFVTLSNIVGLATSLVSIAQKYYFDKLRNPASQLL